MLWSIDNMFYAYSLSSTLTHLFIRSVPLVSDLLSFREPVCRLLGRVRHFDQLVGPNTSYISTYKHIEGHILAPGQGLK